MSVCFFDLPAARADARAEKPEAKAGLEARQVGMLVGGVFELIMRESGKAGQARSGDPICLRCGRDRSIAVSGKIGLEAGARFGTANLRLSECR